MKNNIFNLITVLVAYLYVTSLILFMLLKDYQLSNNDLFLAMISIGHVIVDRIEDKSYV